MDYESFLSYVKKNILFYMDYDEEVVVKLHQVIKNNGITLDGLSIHRKDERMAPNIYLNSFFVEYEAGKNIDSIMQEIASQYHSLAMELEVSPDDIYDFEKVKDHIILRLVGIKNNQKLLENCPYIVFEDLAVTFRWLVCMEDAGIATILITNKELECWEQTKEELYETALENTKRIFPAVIRPLGNMLAGYLKDIVNNVMFTEEENNSIREDVAAYVAGEQLRPTLFVLTNEQGINGATCLLYEGVVEEFADSIQQDLYVLPSSIHELILIPDTEEVTKEEFQEMVAEANDTVVFDSDVLSDSVYYFSRNEKSVKRL